MAETLQKNVENWHGLDFAKFGELRLHGLLQVSRDQKTWRKLECYLFTEILVCIGTTRGAGSDGKPTLRSNIQTTLEGFVLLKSELVAVSAPKASDEYTLTIELSAPELPEFHLSFKAYHQFRTWKEELLQVKSTEVFLPIQAYYKGGQYPVIISGSALFDPLPDSLFPGSQQGESITVVPQEHPADSRPSQEHEEDFWQPRSNDERRHAPEVKGEFTHYNVVREGGVTRAGGLPAGDEKRQSGLLSGLRTWVGQRINQTNSIEEAVRREVGTANFRAFRAAWKCFDPSNTGYISKDDFPRLLGELSGQLSVRIYDAADTVGSILEYMRRPSRWNNLHNYATLDGLHHYATIGDLFYIRKLNDRISQMDAGPIQKRRGRLRKIWHETMATADPEKGISRDNLLITMCYYCLERKDLG